MISDQYIVLVRPGTRRQVFWNNPLAALLTTRTSIEPGARNRSVAVRSVAPAGRIPRVKGFVINEEGVAMLKKALAGALFLGAVSALPAMAADDTIARFNGGIGVIPVSSGVAPVVSQLTSEVVNRNFVRGVQPAGQIWVIDKLDARVRASGQITVRGKGLILGGGNNAGRATGQSVFATLICDVPVTTPPTPFTQHSTNLTGVLLSPGGDFKIDDTLSPVLPLPFDCANPMLLIRTAGSGNWFAVGIPHTGNDD